MLFNSSIFLLIFWPLTGIITWLLARKQGIAAQVFLAAASIVFYGWWNPAHVVLLLGSIFANYGIGCLMFRAGAATKRTLLILGILLNIGLLAYYKYWTFLCENLGVWLNFEPPADPILLPLAISFFTFTQITYLCDLVAGKIESNGLWDYVLFVAFFPHLIAGPIVHHRQLTPQFRGERVFRLRLENFVPGVALFILGLSKKMLIADTFAPFADQVFQQASTGMAVPVLQAWYGVLAYAWQIYFDFSGYSDMALGLALTFNLRFPANFFSPYKADSVISFWRRWHITLSQFLRDYLYIPLGGSRSGMTRMLANLLITMLIGGLWHGAKWTFVFWGGLHGLFLVINHLWNRLRQKKGWNELPRAVAIPLTLVCVLIAWVFFRADTFAGAWKVVGSMFGAGMGEASAPFSVKGGEALLMLAALFIVLKAPNTMQIMKSARPFLGDAPCADAESMPLEWRLTPRWAAACGILFAACLIRLNQPSPFIYFQF
ncbi:MAG: MBOAT family O-acyltransferase [Prosthecobacter sp.]